MFADLRSELENFLVCSTLKIADSGFPDVWNSITEILTV
jgi:hypothetical protein